jgi:hypothetical protein
MTNNPFTVTHDSVCEDCGDEILVGEQMFADEGEFVCPLCAMERNIVCPECASYKKVGYEYCYRCHMDGFGVEEDENDEDDEF